MHLFHWLFLDCILYDKQVKISELFSCELSSKLSTLNGEHGNSQFVPELDKSVVNLETQYLQLASKVRTVYGT